jgi:acyl-CoA thioesterase-1
VKFNSALPLFPTALLFAVLLFFPGPPAQGAGPIRILAMGDSLTAGYGLREADGFTAQLQNSLRQQGFDVDIVNAGVSGDTTSGGLARLDWALADNPDAVILELGANDGLRGIDPSITRANLGAMLEKLKQRELPVLLAGMYAPTNLGPQYVDQFNSIYPQLAAEHGVFLYPFFLDGVAAVVNLNQEDGIHPTREGVAVIVGRILPYVTELIEQIQAGR